MPVKSFRPLTPSTRYITIASFSEITKSKPEKSLIYTRKKTGGRNSYGRVTSRGIGRGHKQKVRTVDFRRNKLGMDAKAAARPVICQGKHLDHLVIIHDDTSSQGQIDAHICDTVTITNLDSKIREIAFGEHIHHVVYNGVESITIDQGQSFTFTLDKSGSYKFHDHFQESVYSNFTVYN